MKTKMNIICLLIFASILASIVEFIIVSGNDVAAGFMRGFEEGGAGISVRTDIQPKDTETQAMSMFLNLRPKDNFAVSDSLFNEATGQWMPAQFRGNVVVEQAYNHVNPWRSAIIMINTFIVLIAIITLFITFIRLINKINKSVIFDWGNVAKLRRIGYCMIIMFVGMGLMGWMHHLDYTANVVLKDYVISADGIWNFTLLISGLAVLLMGEIFAIGLRMQEEQELTI